MSGCEYETSASASRAFTAVAQRRTTRRLGSASSSGGPRLTPLPAGMAQRTLFVILGAGASFDASSRYGAPDTRPPLVSGLFDTRFDGLGVRPERPPARHALLVDGLPCAVVAGQLQISAW